MGSIVNVNLNRRPFLFFFFLCPYLTPKKKTIKKKIQEFVSFSLMLVIENGYNNLINTCSVIKKTTLFFHEQSVCNVYFYLFRMSIPRYNFNTYKLFLHSTFNIWHVLPDFREINFNVDINEWHIWSESAGVQASGP